MTHHPMSKSGRSWRRLLACAGALLAMAACSREAPNDTSVVRSAERDGTTLTVRVERESVEAGEPFRMTIEVAGPDGRFPPPLAATLGPFDVRPVAAKAEAEAAPVPADRRVATYELSTLESGDVAIPPIELTLGEGDDATTLATEPIPMTVASLLGGDDDPGNYRDIKGVVDIPLPFDAMRAALFAAIALGVTLSAAWLWFMLRRSARALALLPADQRALRDLAALESRKLPASGRMHEFYVEVTDIVRTYIERRFGIRAPELTTPEFLREARRASEISDQHQRLLSGFLRGADLVKFGGVKPSASQCDESLAHARTFVRESAPQPEAARPQTGPSGGSGPELPPSSAGMGVPA